MSASPSMPSPAGASDGKTPTSNNGQPRLIRRPKPADPLRQAKRVIQKPAPMRQKPAGSGSRTSGGLVALNKGMASMKPVGGYAIPKNQGPGPATSNGSVKPQTEWSESVAPSSFQEYPLFTTKRALKEGLRYHIARFQAKKDVDPRNQDDFIRPVSLHRRDPRQPAPGKAVKDEEMTEPVDEKERERQEIARAEKEAQRAADLAQIAPSGNNASAMAAKKTQAFRNEKTTQIHRIDKTEEDRKQSELRYEEALPWHLEDAEGKQTWVGNYEAALSETNVVLVVDGGRFKMIPMEKWYKFTPKNQFKAMTIEEAEEQMKKKSKPTRWAMHDEEKNEVTRLNQETRRMIGGVYGVKKESASFKNAGKRETADADDLDFDGDDLFQDDDEQATVEPTDDVDAKDAKEKIKREQLGANMFGEADENDIEKELEREEREEELRKKLGKSTKKALKKREKNYLYDSDSSHNDPFDSDESDSDTTDDEKQKEEDRRKDEEAKLKAKSSKLPSGASTKGSNTPSGRPSKHGDPSRKHNHLKRPGSPGLSASEASGNESSRKKHKLKHGSSSQPTPVPSRPMSPAPSSQPNLGSPSRKSSIVNLKIHPSKLSEIQATSPNPSQMSDGEATEMSDSGKPKKNKKFRLKIGGAVSPGGSPAGSRAGSPAVQNAASPGSSTPVASVTAEEIAAALPLKGITIGDLLKIFTRRVTDKKVFIRMVRDVAELCPDKLLRPKKST